MLNTDDLSPCLSHCTPITRSAEPIPSEQAPTEFPLGKIQRENSIECKSTKCITTEEPLPLMSGTCKPSFQNVFGHCDKSWLNRPSTHHDLTSITASQTQQQVHCHTQNSCRLEESSSPRRSWKHCVLDTLRHPRGHQGQTVSGGIIARPCINSHYRTPDQTRRWTPHLPWKSRSQATTHSTH